MGIIGESIETYVSNQIEDRQKLQGKQNRSPQDLSLLSNSNAWLKLASSVIVRGDKDSLNDIENLTSASIADPSTEEGREIISKSDGEQRLRNLGLSNTGLYTGNQLAKKSVLFNTLSEVEGNQQYTFRSGVSSRENSIWNNNSYGLGGTTQGLVPSPGLISAKINCKNRGSIREANVQLKAYNRFQFELIELLYLRLGFTMMLEWGWNKFKTRDKKGKPITQTMGSTLIEEKWFNGSETNDYNHVIELIERYRSINSGNYDGFLGKVVNFDWSFNVDGSYDISLKLITVGDVIESLSLTTPTSLLSQEAIAQLAVDSAGSKNQSDGVKGVATAVDLRVINSPIVTNAGNSELSKSLFIDILKDPKKWTKKDGNFFSLYHSLTKLDLNNDPLPFQDPQDASNTNPPDKEVKKGDELPKYPAPGVDVNKYTYYMTLGSLLEKLSKYVTPSLNDGKMLKFDTGDNNICSVYPYQISLDPRVCLIKPSFGGYDEEAVGDGFNVKTYKSLDLLKPFLSDDENAGYGNIMNIYVNYDFISNILKSDNKSKGITIFKFLEEVCNGINKALGDYQKLEPIIINDQIVTIIDQNPIPGIANSKFKSKFEEPTPFEIFGYNTSGSLPTSNFVKDFGFNTKIGPELASMITIGTTAENVKSKNYDGTAFSKWNIGLKDTYQTTYTDPEETDLTVSTETTDWSPLTFDQVKAMKEKFTNSTIDAYHPFAARRKKIPVTYWGITFDTHRDVECPITNKDYDAVTWGEYCKKALEEKKRQILKEKEKKKREENKKGTSKPPKDTDNYVSWLIKAFGGSAAGQTYDSKLYFNLNNDFIKLGQSLFKGFMINTNNEYYKKYSNPSNSIGFIPVSLNLKIMGLSGVKIYNALNISQRFLPSNYPKALTFITSKVNHEISNNDWTTDFETISTANIKDIPKNFQKLLEVSGNILESSAINITNFGNAFGNYVNKTPWSAVFISWVMKQSQIPFPMRGAHTAYAQAIRENQDNKGKEYPWEYLDPSTTIPQVGDIIIRSRAGNAPKFSDPVWDGFSHGDIVVGGAGSTLLSIGGNVSNTSKVTEVTLNKFAKLPSNYFVILRPTTKINFIKIMAIKEMSKWRWSGSSSLNYVPDDVIKEQDPNNWGLLKQYYEASGLKTPSVPDLVDSDKKKEVYNYYTDGTKRNLIGYVTIKEVKTEATA